MAQAHASLWHQAPGIYDTLKALSDNDEALTRLLLEALDDKSHYSHHTVWQSLIKYPLEQLFVMTQHSAKLRKYCQNHTLQSHWKKRLEPFQFSYQSADFFTAFDMLMGSMLYQKSLDQLKQGNKADAAQLSCAAKSFGVQVDFKTSSKRLLVTAPNQ